MLDGFALSLNGRDGSLLAPLPTDRELAAVGYSDTQIEDLRAFVAGYDATLDMNYRAGVVAGLIAAVGAEVVALGPAEPSVAAVRRAEIAASQAHETLKLRTNVAMRSSFACSAAQIEAKFKHAEVLGVSLPRGAQGFQSLESAVRAFVKDPSVETMQISYRGRPHIAYVRSSDSAMVLATSTNEFSSVWRLNEKQIVNILTRHKL
jgi:hypothetical protein